MRRAATRVYSERLDPATLAMRALSILVLVNAVLGCGRERLRPDDFEQIAADFPPGLSDLTVTDNGHLWAIAERDPVIAEISLETSPPRIIRHPVVGIPIGVDTEALASLGNGRFALGIEGHDLPAANVMYGQLDTAGTITFVPGFALTREQLGIPLRPNQGVEAMCAAGGELFVGVEVTGVTATGTRYAPVVRVNGTSQVVLKLMLTTDRGKLSALSCVAKTNGVIELLAIERDYGVTRILRATLPPGATEIQPHIVLDLWPMIRDRFGAKLNLEGIATLPDGRVVTVNDNQGKGLGGPTWLFAFRAR